MHFIVQDVFQIQLKIVCHNKVKDIVGRWEAFPGAWR